MVLYLQRLKITDLHNERRERESRRREDGRQVVGRLQGVRDKPLPAWRSACSSCSIRRFRPSSISRRRSCCASTRSVRNARRFLRAARRGREHPDVRARPLRHRPARQAARYAVDVGAAAGLLRAWLSDPRNGADPFRVARRRHRAAGRGIRHHETGARNALYQRRSRNSLQDQARHRRRRLPRRRRVVGRYLRCLERGRRTRIRGDVAHRRGIRRRLGLPHRFYLGRAFDRREQSNAAPEPPPIRRQEAPT